MGVGLGCETNWSCTPLGIVVYVKRDVSGSVCEAQKITAKVSFSKARIYKIQMEDAEIVGKLSNRPFSTRAEGFVLEGRQASGGAQGASVVHGCNTGLSFVSFIY